MMLASAGAASVAATCSAEPLELSDFEIEASGDIAEAVLERSTRRSSPLVESRVLVFSSATLASRHGLVFDGQTGAVLTDPRYGYGPDKVSLAEQRSASLTQEHPSTDGAVLLGGAAVRNFGHWLIDYLPRIELANDLGLLSAQTPVLISNLRPTWTSSMLDAFGVAEQQIVQFDPRSVQRHTNLTVLPLLRHAGSFLGAHPRSAWDRLLERFGIRRSREEGVRLFVRRGGWPSRARRHLSNEDEVASALAADGFVSFVPQEHSLRQQLAAFADASHIVGEDGSALHLSLASRPGTRVVVLQQRPMQLHVALARSRGHRLVVMSGTPVGGGFVVDPDLVRRIAS